jgi:hypothetical protein
MDAWLLPVIEAGMLTLAAALLTVLLIACEIGFRIGRWRRAHAGTAEKEGSEIPMLVGGMLALVAFVLGLAVNFAQNRFEDRRQFAAVEANAIGTAWLRARLVGGPEGGAIAPLIVDYAKARLAFSTAEFGQPLERIRVREGDDEAKIWDEATKLAARAPTPVTTALINALNEMFDSALLQRFAFASGAPPGILTLLVVGSLTAIFAVGYQIGLAGRREQVFSSLLVVMWVGAIVIAVDLSRPRLGLVRVDASPLVWTLRNMSAPAPP